MVSPAGQVTFQDAVSVIRAGLIAADAGRQVVGKVPNPRPAEFVHLRRTGGVAVHVADRAFVTVDCWAATDLEASALAAGVRRDLHALSGSAVDVSGTRVPVYGVAELAGPADVPDEGESESSRVRQSFEIGLRGLTS